MAFDPRVHLAWGDVSIDSGDPPSKARFFLKRLKTDQFGRGVEVFVGATRDVLCPVKAIVDYAAIRGQAAGPFFCFCDGTPVTKTSFVDRVQQALIQLGLPSSDYYGHSFRIGATTAAANAGIQDSTIQAMGRWASSAFRRYIHTPQDVLAGHSRTLARVGRNGTSSAGQS